MMPSIIETALDVRCGRVSATALVAKALERIQTVDPAINAVTRLTRERAIESAHRIDEKVARGEQVGRLAGIPFGVKDLFDVQGLVNHAGAKANSSHPLASGDAEAVQRLTKAGAILVATLNMDAHAYGFATINAEYGTTANPHDPTRLAGGSSGGSAAAVAAEMLPFALGSDTNGSIRVPAALCGLYGLKPTHGSLPMAGVTPFVDSFDDIGPLASRLDDLGLIYEVLAGTGLAKVTEPLRVATLGGWFIENSSPSMRDHIDALTATLSLPVTILPRVSVAREAAFVMTAAEGGALHLSRLRTQALDYDPQVRDRLLAGAVVPFAAYREAERLRAWFLAQALALFEQFDVLVAPATPCAAPEIKDPFIEIAGKRVPARSHLGFFTQPLSFIGLPVLAVPLKDASPLMLGLQLVGAPGSEAKLFAFARQLEATGIAGAPRCRLAEESNSACA